jgi:RNA polymerase sigma-32 factor
MLERAGRPVTCEALASSLGVEPEDVESMAPRLSAHDVSLDGPRGAHDDRSARDLLLDEAGGPEAAYSERQEATRRQARLRASLELLDVRERAIICARHLTDEPETLGEIGARLGVSRERVRQLELRAFKKIQRACLPDGDEGETAASFG